MSSNSTKRKLKARGGINPGCCRHKYIVLVKLIAVGESSSTCILASSGQKREKSRLLFFAHTHTHNIWEISRKASLFNYCCSTRVICSSLTIKLPSPSSALMMMLITKVEKKSSSSSSPFFAISHERVEGKKKRGASKAEINFATQKMRRRRKKATPAHPPPPRSIALGRDRKQITSHLICENEVMIMEIFALFPLPLMSRAGCSGCLPCTRIMKNYNGGVLYGVAAKWIPHT